MAEKHNYDDNLLWCEDCGHTNQSVCPQHGQLVSVKDRGIPSRARLSLPHHLTIKTIALRTASNHVYGVFAKKMLQGRTQFGPVEGVLNPNPDASPENHQLQLKIFDESLAFRELICTDETVCNWMMFVRPAETAAEQNMVAYQYKKKLYFTTIKPVAPGVELRVWYGREYAQLMGLPLLDTNKQPMKTVEHQESGSPTTRVRGTSGVGSVLDMLFQKDQGSKESENVSREAAEVDYDEYETPEMPTEEEPLAIRYNYPGVHNETSKSLKPATENTSLFSCTLCQETFMDFSSQVTHKCRMGKYDLFSVRDGDVKQPLTDMRQSDAGSLQPDADEGEGRRTKSKRKGTPKKVPATVDVAKPKNEKKCSKMFQIPTAPIKRSRGRPRMAKSQNSSVRILSCPECDKVFAKETKLKAHIYTHTGERPFKCRFPNCSKAFTCKFKLGRHELVHSQKRDFSCDYCGKAFARKDHLQIHLKSHDPEKSKYVCETCGREYHSIKGYKTHCAFHAAENGELTCGVCNKIFTSKDNLLHHLKVHTGARSANGDREKKFNCTFCEKAFYTAKDLRRHAVVHTGIREFLCQFCPQSFGRRDHLVRHLRRTHQTEITNNHSDQVEKPESKKTDVGRLENLDIDEKEIDLDYLTDVANPSTDIPLVSRVTTKSRGIIKDSKEVINSLLHRVMCNQVSMEMNSDHHGFLQNSNLGSINSTDLTSAANSLGLNALTDISIPQYNNMDVASRLHSVQLQDVQNIYPQANLSFPSVITQSHQDNTPAAESLLTPSTDTLKALGNFATVNLSQLIQTRQNHQQ